MNHHWAPPDADGQVICRYCGKVQRSRGKGLTTYQFGLASLGIISAIALITTVMLAVITP